MEHVFHQNNTYNLFETVTELEGIPKNTFHTVIDKQGNKHKNIAKVCKCWKEHFQEHLNKIFVHQQSAIDEISENSHSNQHIEPITKEQIQRSIGAMKSLKATGADIISAKVLNAGEEEMI